MTRKKPVRKRPPQPSAEMPPPNPLSATPAQLEAAQEQARQRMLMEHNVLKQKFADESIQRTIAESQNQQMIERLRAAQITIEKLTEDNRKLQEGKSTEDVAAEPEPAPDAPGDPEDKQPGEE